MEESAAAVKSAQEYVASCARCLIPERRCAVRAGSVPHRARARRQGTAEALLADELLVRSLGALPQNYDFEVAKAVERIRREGFERVALQLPEGLQMYACTLVDVLSRLCRTETNPAGCSFVVLADATYGACCVDDLAAWRLGCDFLVHYGHSCLVPVQSLHVKTMYVFVRIAFDVEHLLACVREHFRERSRSIHLMLLSTIQFQSCLALISKSLHEYGWFASISIPQTRPLSRGELLGCTAPVLCSGQETQGDDASVGETTAVLYVGDGRFHLESSMIHNPQVEEFYRYDPYAKQLTREFYDHTGMMRERWDAVQCAREPRARFWGVILGTLGRQGNPKILRRLIDLLRDEKKEFVVILCNEITPEKLQQLSKSGIQVWVQVACPRLSIDWGKNFAPGGAPVLTPYEAMVALGRVSWKQERYPMDYYSKHGGPWSNYFVSEENSAVSMEHADS